MFALWRCLIKIHRVVIVCRIKLPAIKIARRRLSLTRFYLGGEQGELVILSFS
jgi:hypothetical protein